MKMIFQKKTITLSLSLSSLLTCFLTGCHSVEDDIREHGYALFEMQTLKRGEMLANARESQLAQEMKNPVVPEVSRRMLIDRVLSLAFWQLKNRELPRFSEVEKIGLDIVPVKAVNVKSENSIPLIKRVYLITKDKQLYYTTDWRSGGLATLPTDAFYFAANSYRWEVTGDGILHVIGKVDPFIVAASGISFEILYRKHATGYVKTLKPDIYVARKQMNLYPDPPAAIPDLPKVVPGAKGLPGMMGRRGEMGRSPAPGRNGMSGIGYGSSGSNGYDGSAGDPGETV